MDEEYAPDRVNCHYHEQRLTQELERLPRSVASKRYKEFTELIHSEDLGAVIGNSFRGKTLKKWLNLALTLNWLTLLLTIVSLWMSYANSAWHFLSALFFAMGHLAVSRWQFRLNLKLVAIAADIGEFQNGKRSATTALFMKDVV